MQNKKCPICGKDQDEKYKPFCSKRCSEIDLGKWFSGSYFVETEESVDDENQVEK